MFIKGGDPFVMFDPKSGIYYLYCTSNSLCGKKHFGIYKSNDLINWEFVNFAFDEKQENNWGKDWFWAPECYYNPNNEHYYMFYSANVKNSLMIKHFKSKDYNESCKIGVAVSSSPEGPFVNISDEPIDFYPYDKEYINIYKINNNPFLLNEEIITDKKGAYICCIDANLLFDENRIYLFFSRCCYMNCRFDKEFEKYIEESNICAVELETDWWLDKEAKSMPKIKKEYINWYVFNNS